jgi:O-acetyl-ADP-ribose deacetylase (regulator of RNase III)
MLGGPVRAGIARVVLPGYGTPAAGQAGQYLPEEVAQAVLRVRRRLRELEAELAEAVTRQAELRRRLEQFERIAAAAGAAGVAGGRPAQAAPLPPALTAAARDLHRRDVPVRLGIGGSEVIAVIGGAGDPREWWTAIQQLAAPAGKTP